MTIIYRDGVGITAQETDGNIILSEGFAYFETDGNDYKIPIAHVLEVASTQ